LLVLAGCSDNSPKGATLAFLNAMKDGNVEDFRKYSLHPAKTNNPIIVININLNIFFIFFPYCFSIFK
jgi:hypothetical protein